MLGHCLGYPGNVDLLREMRINFDVNGCLHLTFQVEICRLFPRTWALKFMFESIYVLVIQCSVVD